LGKILKNLASGPRNHRYASKRRGTKAGEMASSSYQPSHDRNFGLGRGLPRKKTGGSLLVKGLQRIGGQDMEKENYDAASRRFPGDLGDGGGGHNKRKSRFASREAKKGTCNLCLEIRKCCRGGPGGESRPRASRISGRPRVKRGQEGRSQQGKAGARLEIDCSSGFSKRGKGCLEWKKDGLSGEDLKV